MYAEQLLTHDNTRHELALIADQCSEFITLSLFEPLFKNLPVWYGDFHKVKVRLRRSSQSFDETFNDAFEDEHRSIRQRAIFANGITSFEPCDPTSDEMEPFFVFPIDGFNFMYSKEVENSGTEYKQVFDVLYKHFGDDKGSEIITDLLKFTYTQDNLYEGISSGAEIIIYDTPYYYAIRCSSVDSYAELLTALEYFM